MILSVATLPEVEAKLTADVDQFIAAWNRAAAAAAAAAAQIRAAIAAASGDIDSSGISKAREEIAKVRTTARQAATALKAVGEAGDGFERVAESARKAGDGMRQFGTGAQSSSRDVGMLGESARKAGGILGGAGGMGGGLIGGLAKSRAGMAVLAAAAVALLGTFPALAAGALAVGAALQGLGVAGLVIMGGWRGLEQAGEKLKSSLGGLQKQLESVFRAELSGEFQKLGQTISQLDSPLKGIARAVADVVKAFTGWIRSAEGMNEIRTMLGGVENMMKSLAPGAKALAQSFTAFGAAAAPALDEIGKALSSVFENINKVIQKGKESGQLTKAFEAGAVAIEAFGEVLAGIIDVLIEIGGSAGKPAAEAIKSFGKALQDSAPYIGTFFQSMAILMQVLGKVAEAIGKLLKATEPLQRAFQTGGAAVSDFIKNLDPSKLDEAAKAVGAFALKLGADIKTGAEKAVAAVKKWWEDTKKEVKKGADDALKNIKKFVEDPGKELKKLTDTWDKNVKKWWDETGKHIKKGTDTAKKEIKKFADDAPKELKKLADKWGPEIAAWWEETSKAIEEGVQDAIDAINDFRERAVDAVVEGVKDFFRAGTELAEGVADGIAAAVDKVVAKAKELAKKALDAIKETLGISSPSVVFRNEVGAMIPEGIAEGIIGNAGKVTDAMRRTGLGAVTAGKTAATAGTLAGRGQAMQLQLKVTGGADSAMGTAIAKLARTGQLRITANAVKR